MRNPRSCGIFSLVMPHRKPGYSVCLLFVYHCLAGCWINEAAVMRTPSAFPMLESATSPRNRQPWQPCMRFCHRRPCAVALRGLAPTGNIQAARGNMERWSRRVDTCLPERHSGPDDRTVYVSQYLQSIGRPRPISGPLHSKVPSDDNLLALN